MIAEKTQRKDAKTQRRKENGLNRFAMLLVNSKPHPPAPSPCNGEGEKNGSSLDGKLDSLTASFAPLRLRAFVLCTCLFILLLAYALRFHNLGAQSLWNDEGSSYVQATRAFSEIAANAARDIHPPGYYWLLAVWRGVTGDSELALRAMSAFASVLTVAFTYALGRRLFNPLAGVFAALLVALNTFSIYYAQEARMYALLALWGVMGMWALAGLLNPSLNPSPNSGRDFKTARARFFSLPLNSGVGLGTGVKWALALALINAAGLYTQYAYPFVMLAQGAVALVWLAGQVAGTRYSVSLRMLSWYVAANVVTVVLYLPWLSTALAQVTQWPSTGKAIPAGEALQTIGGWFAMGVTAPYTNPSRAVSVIAIFGALAILIGWLLARSKAVWQRALPILWMIVPVGLFLVLGLFRPANLKFLLPSQIGFALFLGQALARLWEGFRGFHLYAGVTQLGSSNRQSIIFSRIVAAVVTAALLLSLIQALPYLYTDPAYQRPDYREMVRQITVGARPGDAVILDAPNQEEVFRYYYKGDAPVYPLPPGLGGDDAETAALTGDIIAGHERIFVLLWGEAERDPNRVVERELDVEAYPIGNDVWYGDVRLAAYSIPKVALNFTPSETYFGDSIKLELYGLNTTTVHPGDELQILLEWRATAPQTTVYKVFVQLLNGNGRVVSQRDSEPVDGHFPTTSWQSGIYGDRHGLTIPPDLPPGDYRLIVGLYDRVNPAARLAVNGSDYLELGRITVGG